jgi:hypothetical protein
MSFTVTDAFVQQFTGNVHFLAQQMVSRFRSAVVEDTITGESAYMEQIAPTVARKIQSRHADTPIMNTQHLRRRLAPYGYNWGDLTDRLDKVRLLIDPASAYARNAAMAMRRAIDDEVIGAFYATAYTGHSGSTQVTWPNGNNESTPTTPAGTQVAVNDWTFGNGSGNAGLTISKLISAMVALDAAEGDEEEEDRFIALTARQKGQLLATTEVTSADYNTVRALYDGKVDRFMNFKVIHSERLQTNGSGYWRVPAWRKSAMGLGIAQDIQGQIAQRPDKNFSWQVYADESIGATRLEEVKLVEVICQ